MRLPLLLLLGALLGDFAAQAQTQAAVTSSTLDESEVRITYGELKRLVAATLPEEVPPIVNPPPAVPAALLSTVYRLDAAKNTLIADLRAENFEGGWHCIPLAGACSGAMSVLPPEARVVVHEDQICLITDKAGASSIKLTFPLSPEGQGTSISLAPAAIACMEISSLPTGKVVRILHAGVVKSLTDNGTVILPAGGGDVCLVIEEIKPASPVAVAASGSLTDDAIVTKATFATEVVRDGSVFTEGGITVRHDLPVHLTIQFPEAAKLLQCHVNSVLVRPVVNPDGALEIPLDNPSKNGAESEVKLSFTSLLPALQTAEGEIALALPQIPLFAHQIDWTVQMPSGFDLTVSGNVEQIAETPSAPAASPGLHLRKSLCRNQQPQARITYRKH